jgi:MoaA/NifB/PqqE/SkfB family radical SAM enzyme
MDNFFYDAWLHWTINLRCNLDCKYCFPNLMKKIAKIKTINIGKVVKTLDETNKIFKISFTGGGEPFLVSNINELCYEITKKHYIAFNSNLTVKKIKEFAANINPEKVLQSIASLHIEELFARKLVSNYIENFHLLKSKGIDLLSSAVAYPELINKADYYKEFFFKNGVEFFFVPFIGRYNKKYYPKAYTDEELKVFNISRDSLICYSQKNKICNVGYNVGIINYNGKIYTCNDLMKKYGNIYKKIKFHNFIVKCPKNNCSCPLNLLDMPLFNKAVETKDMKIKKYLF